MIVDDDPFNVQLLQELLHDTYELRVAKSGEQAVQLCRQENQPNLILLDIELPDMDGYATCQTLKGQESTAHIPVIFITVKGLETDETKGFEVGAVDYITKPFSPTVIKARIHTHLSVQRSLLQAQELLSLRNEVKHLTQGLLKDTLQQPDAFAAIITQHPSMFALFRYMEALAKTNEPILIQGESGTGKELIADALHKLNGRSGKQVSVNVAGLDDFTFSDTLFGHRRGAFTGADSNRDGFIAQAEGGTLFLDEIGDLSNTSQIKLLRVIQERRYYPLGMDQSRPMDVFLICATHQNLEEKVKEGSFRQDLYFRLNSHRIALPALKDRLDDLPYLVEHFIQESAQILGKEPPIASKRMMLELDCRTYPGNVRELRGTIFDAMVQHQSNQELELPGTQGAAPMNLTLETPDSAPKDMESYLDQMDGFPTLDQMERQLVTLALAKTNGNQKLAASLLGLSRQALNRRLNRRLKDLNGSPDSKPLE
uniref:Putative Two component, sigma54 specific, transcriptional regulator n=1 Tax=Magnetococcus massalia (strain MO-1) TaxID=451514 RepID=A0A1S7LIQ9_MAGMO|nr:putative Two component, sigma54 specific, transcriptional regulator [Candidatus Magnetococcus massalia]